MSFKEYDDEWERLFHQAKNKEATAYETSVIHSVTAQVFKNFTQLAIIGLLFIFGVWVYDFYVPFSPSEWRHRHSGTNGHLLWTRFEHQYQLQGMNRTATRRLLGDPDGNSSLIDHYWISSTGFNKGKDIYLHFWEQKVTHYKVKTRNS